MGESEEGLSDSLELDCHHALFDDEDDKVIDNADDKDDIDEDKGHLMRDAGAVLSAALQSF